MPVRVNPQTGERIQQQQAPSQEDAYMNSLRQQIMGHPGSVQAGREISVAKYLEDLNKETEPSAEEKKEKKQKQLMETVISNLENDYFENKLYYGMTPAAILAHLKSKFNPNEPYRIYKDNLESIGARLAKEGGDAANIAVAEQLMQQKAFPNIFNTKDTAIERFKDIRSKYGLDQRSYSRLIKSTNLPSSWQEE